MISIQNIIDAINIALLVPFPEHFFYIEQVPKDFKRPSFYIQLVDDTWQDSNRATTIENPSFQIVYFGNENAHRIVNTTEKLNVYEAVKSVFKQGYIKVNNEVIKLAQQGFRAELREMEVFFTVDFEYFALREGIENNLHVANELNLNMKGE